MDLHNLIMRATYKSYELFPSLADVLADLKHRNGNTLALIAYRALAFPGDSTCDTSTLEYNLALTKCTTVCTDMDDRYNISSVDEYQTYIDQIQGVSKYLGPP